MICCRHIVVALLRARARNDATSGYIAGTPARAAVRTPRAQRLTPCHCRTYKRTIPPPSPHARVVCAHCGAWRFRAFARAMARVRAPVCRTATLYVQQGQKKRRQAWTGTLFSMLAYAAFTARCTNTPTHHTVLFPPNLPDRIYTHRPTLPP